MTRCSTLLVLLLALAPSAAAAPVTPVVRVRSARVVGDTPATEAAARTAEAGRPDLLRCYAAERQARPGSVGLLVLDLTVAPGGAVTAVTVIRGSLTGGLRSCAVAAARTWKHAAWTAKAPLHAVLELVFELHATPARGMNLTGGLPPAVVAGTVEARVDEMRTRCFASASKLPRFTLSFAVDFDGTLESRSVQGTLAGPALACLNEYLKTWVFPPPDNGRRSWLRYPVDLVPAAGAPPPRSPP